MFQDSGAADQALNEAAARRRQVQAAGPDERRIALGWAVVVLIFVPLYDALDYALASSLMITAAILAFVATRVYSRRRNAQVRPRSQRALGWGLWGLWYGACILAAVLLQDSIDLAFTAAAILAALPLLAFGLGLIGRPS